MRMGKEFDLITVSIVKLNCLAICFALLTAFATGEAAATTYYVSTKGSDSNPGSESQPLRTIQEAADKVSLGDTVIVKDGTYHESVKFYKDGSEGYWITFKSENKWGAKVDGQLNYKHIFHSDDNLRFNKFEGFEITGSYDSGISFNGDDSYIKIYNNYIHHTGKICSGTDGGLNGIKIGTNSRYIYIDGNVIRDVGRKDDRVGCSVFDRSHDHGVYTAASYIYITNNIFYDNRMGWSIQFSGGGGPKYVINNVFANPNPEKYGHIVIWNSHGPNTDVLIQNNIFYNPKGAAVHCSRASGSTLIFKNNLIYPESRDTFTTGCPSGFSESGTIKGDSKFVNPSDNDYHLRSDSPAIDNGVNSSLVSLDHDGNSRPQGNAYDIGAYEFGSGSVGDYIPPSPPVKLSVQ